MVHDLGKLSRIELIVGLDWGSSNQHELIISWRNSIGFSISSIFSNLFPDLLILFILILISFVNEKKVRKKLHIKFNLIKWRILPRNFSCNNFPKNNPKWKDISSLIIFQIKEGFKPNSIEYFWGSVLWWKSYFLKKKMNLNC